MASQTTLFDFFKKKPATSASEQLTENDSGDATNAEVLFKEYTNTMA